MVVTRYHEKPHPTRHDVTHHGKQKKMSTRSSGPFFRQKIPGRYEDEADEKEEIDGSGHSPLLDLILIKIATLSNVFDVGEPLSLFL